MHRSSGVRRRPAGLKPTAHAWLSTLVIAGCSPTLPAAAPPPPPPEAAEIPYSGSYLLATGALVDAVRGQVRGAHGEVTESRNWRMPSDTRFSAVRSYYAAALKGWTPLNSVAAPATASYAVWKAPGEALAIGLVDGEEGAGEPRKVLVVMRFER